MNNPTNKTAYNLLLKNWFQYEAGRSAIFPLFYHGLEKNSCVNCFVNLNNYFSPLYKRNDYLVDDIYSIAASVINFCAHIINFFDTRFGMKAAVYLVFGSYRPNCTIKTWYAYNAHRVNEISTKPDIEKLIFDNLEIIKTICPYIPNVYFIKDMSCEPAVAIRRIIKYISLKGNKYPRLIFSKEYFDLQLVTTVPQTHLVRVKKTKQGDRTFTVSYFNFYNTLTRIKKLKAPIGNGISPELYSLYLAYMGCPDRNISGVINAPRANAYISELISSGRILNGYNNSFIASDKSAKALLETPLDIEGVIDRYKAVDLFSQSLRDEDFTTPMLDMAIAELYDPNGVRYISDQYFQNYPLDLNVF